QAEDGIRDLTVTGVQTCALPIFRRENAGGAHAKLVRVRGVAISFVERDEAGLEEIEERLVESLHAVLRMSRSDCLAYHVGLLFRSEERRVGKECSTRWVWFVYR